jgi:hypothetical protein
LRVALQAELQGAQPGRRAGAWLRQPVADVVSRGLGPAAAVVLLQFVSDVHADLAMHTSAPSSVAHGQQRTVAGGVVAMGRPPVDHGRPSHSVA